MFTAALIRDRVRDQPFVPLRIVTSSGQTFDVYHPDLIWIGRNELYVGMPSPDDPTLHYGTMRIAIMHVTALEELPARKKRDGNGRHRK